MAGAQEVSGNDKARLPVMPRVGRRLSSRAWVVVGGIPWWTECPPLRHQIQGAGALDFASDPAVDPCGDAGDASWDDFAGIGGEFP